MRALTSADYNTMGLSPYASVRQLKKAYRRLALRHHPDRAGLRQRDRFQATEHFEKIQNAYEAILTSLHSRDDKTSHVVLMIEQRKARQKEREPQTTEQMYQMINADLDRHQWPYLSPAQHTELHQGYMAVVRKCSQRFRQALYHFKNSAGARRNWTSHTDYARFFILIGKIGRTIENALSRATCDTDLVSLELSHLLFHKSRLNPRARLEHYAFEDSAAAFDTFVDEIWIRYDLAFAVDLVRDYFRSRVLVELSGGFSWTRVVPEQPGETGLSIVQHLEVDMRYIS